MSARGAGEGPPRRSAAGARPGRLEARRGLHPAAVDADLALAAHLLDPRLVHLRMQPAQPSVEALFRIAGGDGELADPAHGPAGGRASSTATAKPAERPRRARRRRSRPASAGRPRSASRKTSSEKAEKVVKPPSTPVIRNGAACCEAELGPAHHQHDRQPHREAAEDVHRERAPGETRSRAGGRSAPPPGGAVRRRGRRRGRSARGRAWQRLIAAAPARLSSGADHTVSAPDGLRAAAGRTGPKRSAVKGGGIVEAEAGGAPDRAAPSTRHPIRSS